MKKTTGRSKNVPALIQRTSRKTGKTSPTPSHNFFLDVFRRKTKQTKPQKKGRIINSANHSKRYTLKNSLRKPFHNS